MIFNQKSIKYIGYYFDPALGGASRSYSPAATTKMDYISDVLVRCGHEVEIISPCKASAPSIAHGQKIDVAPHVRLYLLLSLGCGGKVRNALDFILGNIILFFYLLLKVKRGEVVIVYHSLGYGAFINFAKKLRGFKVVLEAEEVYQDVVSCHEWQRRDEDQSFLLADGFIFPTNLLELKLNLDKKPSIVVHGTYSTHASHGDDSNDELVHVVYAGTFDSSKGGVYSAITSARFLPSKYRLHILGFGTDEEVESVIKLISEVNSLSLSCARVDYHGLLVGDEYGDFLSRCSIGLSTQTPSGIYNSTSFPSKVLSYMSYGLQVVSIRIEAVETSGVASQVHFYDADDPQSIAEAILSVDLASSSDPREMISQLDAAVVKAMPSFLASLTNPLH